MGVSVDLDTMMSVLHLDKKQTKHAILRGEVNIREKSRLNVANGVLVDLDTMASVLQLDIQHANMPF